HTSIESTPRTGHLRVPLASFARGLHSLTAMTRFQLKADGPNKLPDTISDGCRSFQSVQPCVPIFQDVSISGILFEPNSHPLFDGPRRLFSPTKRTDFKPCEINLSPTGCRRT